jgi:hypothetical protein
MLMKSKKPAQTKRNAIMDLIRDNPGITSQEMATRLGFSNTTRVTGAVWKEVRANRVIVERISKDGNSMNAHYLSGQVPPDAVERISQKLVSAEDVIPEVKSPGARNSVFDVPGTAKIRRKRATSKAVTRDPAPVKMTPPTRSKTAPFACAVTNDGSLVLMREGQIQFSLSDVEATTLQNYLVKRAAANMFASMA